MVIRFVNSQKITKLQIFENFQQNYNFLMKVCTSTIQKEVFKNGQKNNHKQHGKMNWLSTLINETEYNKQ